MSVVWTDPKPHAGHKIEVTGSVVTCVDCEVTILDTDAPEPRVFTIADGQLHLGYSTTIGP